MEKAGAFGSVYEVLMWYCWAVGSKDAFSSVRSFEAMVILKIDIRKYLIKYMQNFKFEIVLLFYFSYVLKWYKSKKTNLS